MRPIRVLTVGHSYVVELNRAVMEQVARDPSIELTVAAPTFFHGDLRPIALEETAPHAYRLVGLPAYLSPWIHVFRYGGLRDLVRGGRFDLVHAWEEPYIVAGHQIARAAREAGTRYFFRTAQSLPKRYPPPFAQFERYCVDSASGWIAGGWQVQEALLERGYPRTNAEVITLGVDEDHFYPDLAEGQRVRRELGLSSGPVVGYIGRLCAAKGLDLLMAALERVEAPWSLLALGSGPYEPVIRRWAEAHGWTDRVRVLMARHAEVPSYLRAMDLLTVPSQTMPNWKEQFGRVIIEAFACEVPVIGSDSGEIPYLVEGVGIVADESDVDAWARAIGDLVESPARRRLLGEAGRERCQRHYTATRVAQKYLEYYRRLADAPAPPARRPQPMAVASAQPG